MNMRLLGILILFPLSAVFGQIGTGQWRLHIPANRAIDVVALDDRVFAAYENGLSEYDYSSEEISTWDLTNGLSDIKVSCLAYAPSVDAIVVGYENGNLDLIQNNTVYNIPAIKIAELQGSKRINKIQAKGGFLYLSTGFAIVKIDPVKREVKDTFYPTNGNDPILDLAFRNDSIFALAEDKLYVGLTNNIALADPSQWTVDPRVPVATSTAYAEIEVVGSELFILEKIAGFGLDSIYRLGAADLQITVNESFPMEVTGIQAINNTLAVNYLDGTLFYDASYAQMQVINQFSFGLAAPNRIAYADNAYWIADGNHGLVKYISYGNDKKIAIKGPAGNTYYHMEWENGKLIVACGGLNSVANTFNEAGVFIFEDETWTKIDKPAIPTWASSVIFDFLSTSINPTDESEFAVSTYSELPLSILNSSGLVASYSPANSPLDATSLGNGWTLISDLTYDDEGNLWMLNGYTTEPLKVLANDGQWYSFDLGSQAKNKFTKKMVVDYSGNKWLSVKGVGMYGLNDNGTISNPSDDKKVLLDIGEASGALPSNEVNAIAVDFENEIWIGTDNGFAVLYNADGAFDAGPGEYNAQRIKLEFEGNVEYVLGSTNITDIEVDGANRKWFATDNAGIVLLSPDGLEIIEQHTTDNSPLLSNTIIDLKLDQQTGELFIITDKGLISYRTDATYEDPEYSNVVVFPNPARPEFEGPITIQGIKYNSDVKITDVSGNLIYQTTSNGGTATWNGRTLTGEKVVTGVYLIWTAPNEGKGRFVGKVLVVN